MLFTRDPSFRFSAGKLVGTDTLLNELMVLGFDLYAQPIARTETMLRRLGFDLSRFHESTWQGKPVYVIGALRGDTTSKQFYIDRDRLLFLRVIESTPRGRTDTRYSDYVQYGGGWVATQVEQYVNGRRTVLEQYSGVKVNPPISDALFDPKQWSSGAALGAEVGASASPAGTRPGALVRGVHSLDRRRYRRVAGSLASPVAGASRKSLGQDGNGEPLRLGDPLDFDGDGVHGRLEPLYRADICRRRNLSRLRVRAQPPKNSRTQSDRNERPDRKHDHGHDLSEHQDVMIHFSLQGE